MTATHTDTSTQNARIHIDYKTGDVLFGYPNGKKEANLITRWVALYFTAMISLLELLGAIVVGYILGYLGYSIGLSIFTPTIVAPTPIDTLIGNTQIMWFYFLVFTPATLLLPLAMDTKTFSRVFPKISIITYKIFPWKTINVYEVTNVVGNTIELPFFQNRMLQYKATDDFSKYLEKVDVVEHPFREEGVFSKKVNQYLWKATFTFTETPKVGKMRIEFI